VPQTVTYVD
jgi:hypothetical protein